MKTQFIQQTAHASQKSIVQQKYDQQQQKDKKKSFECGGNLN